MSLANLAPEEVPRVISDFSKGGLVQPTRALGGALSVTDGGPYGENVYYGRVETDGGYQASRSADDGITAVLRKFSANPVSVAAAYGRLTGNCCFCRKTLTDQRSTSVGYGPVCAVHYGLPWGSNGNGS